MSLRPHRDRRLPSGPSPFVALSAALVVTLAGSAEAQVSSTDHEVEVRYRAIVTSLEASERRASFWWYGWTFGYGALAVGQGALALLTDETGVRADRGVGGVQAAIGLGAMLLTRRTPFTAATTLRELEAVTPAARRARLARAEALLEDAADAQRVGRSVVLHLGSAAVSLTGTFVLWLGWNRHASGWLNLIGAVAIGQAQILTQPMAAYEAFQDYKAGRYESMGRPAAITWTLVPTPGGLSIAGVF